VIIRVVVPSLRFVHRREVALLPRSRIGTAFDQQPTAASIT
jgi:hypothetical protein